MIREKELSQSSKWLKVSLLYRVSKIFQVKECHKILLKRSEIKSKHLKTSANALKWQEDSIKIILYKIPQSNGLLEQPVVLLELSNLTD